MLPRVICGCSSAQIRQESCWGVHLHGDRVQVVIGLVDLIKSRLALYSNWPTSRVAASVQLITFGSDDVITSPVKLKSGQ